jgi:TetR/AcrR family transcriptional regulator, mexJK operon transcriptional repressor
VVANVRRARAAPEEPKPKEQAVLAVATAYFLRHGYRGASLTAMARGSGISKESFYRYFGSKRELFDAVLDRELVRHGESLRLRAPAAAAHERRAVLVDLATQVLTCLTNDRALARRRLVLEEAARRPELGRRYHASTEQLCRDVARLLRGHAAGAGFDSMTLGRHFLALISWRVLLERECAVCAEPTAEHIAALAEAAAADFARAFLIEKP